MYFLHQKFEHLICYCFFKMSQISTKFGYVTEVGNISLYAKSNHFIVHFTGLHQYFISAFLFKMFYIIKKFVYLNNRCWTISNIECGLCLYI